MLTGRYVCLGDNNHGLLLGEEADVPAVQRRLISKGEIWIGKNDRIGGRATILGGVTIGDNVIIGANSVVTHDIPSNCVDAGVLVKELKILDS